MKEENVNLMPHIEPTGDFSDEYVSCFDADSVITHPNTHSDCSFDDLYHFEMSKDPLQNANIKQPTSAPTNSTKSKILSKVNSSKFVNSLNDELKYSTEKHSDVNSSTARTPNRIRSRSLDSRINFSFSSILSTNAFSSLSEENASVFTADSILKKIPDDLSVMHNKNDLNNSDNKPSSNDNNNVITNDNSNRRNSIASIFSLNLNKNDQNDTNNNNSINNNSNRNKDCNNKKSCGVGMFQRLINSLNDERSTEDEQAKSSDRSSLQQQQQSLDKKELSKHIITLKQEIGSLIKKFNEMKMHNYHRFASKKASLYLKELELLNQEIMCRHEILRDLCYDLRINTNNTDDEEYDEYYYKCSNNNKEEEFDESEHTMNCSISSLSSSLFDDPHSDTGCISSRNRVSFTMNEDEVEDEMAISTTSVTDSLKDYDKSFLTDEIDSINYGIKYQKKASSSQNMFRGTKSNKTKKKTRVTTLFGPGA